MGWFELEHKLGAKSEIQMEIEIGGESESER